MKTENILLLLFGAGTVYYLYNRSRVPVVPRVLPPDTNSDIQQVQTNTNPLQVNVTTLQSNNTPYGTQAPTSNNPLDFLTNG